MNLKYWGVFEKWLFDLFYVLLVIKILIFFVGFMFKVVGYFWEIYCFVVKNIFDWNINKLCNFMLFSNVVVFIKLCFYGSLI